MTELEAVRILHSPLSGPSARYDAERELERLGWRPLAISLAKGQDPEPVTLTVEVTGGRTILHDSSGHPLPRSHSRGECGWDA